MTTERSLLVIRRTTWGARPARPGMPELGHARGVIVHHTATTSDETTPRQLCAIQAYHQDQRGWPDIAYHRFIDRHGIAWEGRDLRYAGDSHTPYNLTGWIQVALLGNFETQDPTAEQLDAARQTVHTWQALGLPISAHQDHADTTCPGAHLLPHIREWSAP